jgi:DNA-binding transcriptional regulator YdaS (Cro superfamily)
MYHDRIKKRIELIGIKNGTLAALVGLQAPKLSIWLKGRCELPPATMKKIDGTLSDLVLLQKCFPVRVDLNDAKLLAKTLERFRDGLFKPFRKLTLEFAHESNLNKTQKENPYDNHLKQHVGKKIIGLDCDFCQSDVSHQ